MFCSKMSIITKQEEFESNVVFRLDLSVNKASVSYLLLL